MTLAQGRVVMSAPTTTTVTPRCQEASASHATAATTSTSPGQATVTPRQASASSASSTPTASTVSGASQDSTVTPSTRSAGVSLYVLPFIDLFILFFTCVHQWYERRDSEKKCYE